MAGDKPGAAQIMKLTNNILFAVALIATSEAMTMATRGGIPPGFLGFLLRGAAMVSTDGVGGLTTQACPDPCAVGRRGAPTRSPDDEAGALSNGAAT